MERVFSSNRLIETLKKYDNHNITSIYHGEKFIQIELEFISKIKKSKTTTIVNIYCDNYFELEKSKKEQEDEPKQYL